MGHFSLVLNGLSRSLTFTAGIVPPVCVFSWGNSIENLDWLLQTQHLCIWTSSYAVFICKYAHKFSQAIQLYLNHSQATLTLSQRGTCYKAQLWSGATGNSHTLSTSYNAPFQIASWIKTIQLWRLKNHRGNRSVQSHRGITCKQRGGLNTERTWCTQCFLSLSAWWGSPTDRGQAETDEDRTRCAGPVLLSLKTKHAAV